MFGIVVVGDYASGNIKQKSTLYLLGLENKGSSYSYDILRRLVYRLSFTQNDTDIRFLDAVACTPDNYEVALQEHLSLLAQSRQIPDGSQHMAIIRN